MGVSMTIRLPDGFSEDDRDVMTEALMRAAGCQIADNHDERACPVESIGTSVGTSATVYLWHWKDSEALDRVKAIKPEDHATKSRDYGRGFADAIERVRTAIADDSELRAELAAEDATSLSPEQQGDSSGTADREPPPTAPCGGSA